MADERKNAQSIGGESVDVVSAPASWYVYVYRDPYDSRPFYIGKGTDLRAFSHVNGHGSKETDSKIKIIRERGREPEIEIVARNLSESVAYYVEMALIEFVGIDNLTNKQHGRNHKKHGSVAANRLLAYLEGEALDEESFKGFPAIVFRINKLYRPKMNAADLYDITRGFWRVDLFKAKRCKYAMCAYEGRILEIYEIGEWFSAGTTFMLRKMSKSDGNKKEFVGRICTEAAIRKRFLGKSISRMPGYGSRNEFLYFGLDSEKGMLTDNRVHVVSDAETDKME